MELESRRTDNEIAVTCRTGRGGFHIQLWRNRPHYNVYVYHSGAQSPNETGKRLPSWIVLP